MTTLTAHQVKRIRSSDADDIARMVNQERYWSPTALRAVLNRVEILSEEQAQPGVAAGLSALEILERLPDAKPDLRALALATCGSTLRRSGEIEQALDTYKNALNIEGLSSAGRCGVLQRMAIALAYVGQIDRGLKTISEALQIEPNNITSRSVRALLRMLHCDLEAALNDCLGVLRDAELPADLRAVISVLGNIANILSYEAIATVNVKSLADVQETIARVRETLPNGGSSYYRMKRPRLLLSRAEALFLTHAGKRTHAVAILRRVTNGLEDSYPEDALFASADLLCLHSRLKNETSALKESHRTLRLLGSDQSTLHQTLRGLLQIAIAQDSLTLEQAIEIRALLRLK